MLDRDAHQNVKERQSKNKIGVEITTLVKEENEEMTEAVHDLLNVIRSPSRHNPTGNNRKRYSLRNRKPIEKLNISLTA